MFGVPHTASERREMRARASRCHKRRHVTATTLSDQPMRGKSGVVW
jgi:hypothetical protein